MAKLLWWHRVGQKVVCIDATPCAHGLHVMSVPLRNGCIYTIRELFHDLHYPDVWPIFRLVEVEGVRGHWALGSYEAGFRHSRFRPVRETSIEQFRSLLSPTPKDVRELEEERV